MNRSKRAFDVTLSIVGLALLWPLLLVIAALVKSDGGPVFFRQERVGRFGRPFRIWKFRTMVVDAERMGLQITAAGDPRITRVGDWLRQTKLDELPQLFNVLAGQMSFVGPRPEVPRYVALYDAEQMRVLELTPGITDPASLRYFDESHLLAGVDDPESAYVHDIMPAKIRVNLTYAEHATHRDDLRMLFRTAAHIFAHHSSAIALGSDAAATR